MPVWLVLGWRSAGAPARLFAPQANTHPQNPLIFLHRMPVSPLRRIDRILNDGDARGAP
jgi:hypothetical protein